MKTHFVAPGDQIVELAEVIKLNKAGVSINEIAKALGVRPGTLSAALKTRMGHRSAVARGRTGHRVKPETIARLRRFADHLEAGGTQGSFAELEGVSRQRIGQLLDKAYGK